MKNMQFLSKPSFKRAFAPVFNGLSAALLLSMPLSAQTSAQTSQAQDFIVKSSSTSTIKSGARSFKKGDYDLAVTYNMKALDSGLSPRRKAVAYNNLCAAYGAQGDYAKAFEACQSALSLDADFSEAQQNQALVKSAMDDS